ncbi:MAG: hypothetical protein ACQEQ4_09310 [Fibrobacterota bacterium]
MEGKSRFEVLQALYRKTRLMVSALRSRDIPLFSRLVTERGALLEENTDGFPEVTGDFTADEKEMVQKIHEADSAVYDEYTNVYASLRDEYRDFLQDSNTFYNKKNAAREYLIKPPSGSFFDSRR